MATRPIGGAAARVTLPGTMPHMPAVAQILARYDRAAFESFISIAIELADTLDGDSDVEFNGDESDHGLGEDDFCPHGDGYPTPGCPISDPDEAVDDRPCDDVVDPDLEIDHFDAPAPTFGIDQAEPDRIGGGAFHLAVH